MADTLCTSTSTSSPERDGALGRFAREYRTVRKAEGWGSADGAYYRALPYHDLTHRFERIWRIRTRSFETFVDRILRPLEDRFSRPLMILDLGAGNGWLSYRLAQRGHLVTAIDLTLDPLDGLGAIRHYDARFLPVQAEFDHLPIRDSVADLAIFNASLHYSPNYVDSIGEALRATRPEATLAVLDSPFYGQAASGQRMVRDRQHRFLAAYGFTSDSLQAEHFLTRTRLDEIAQAHGIHWRILPPRTTLRGRIGRRVMNLRLRRETAEFPVIVGTRA
ncbi:MAG: methyltransferase domain-containing protein [Chloroflexi bacterium]|nr:methyltransferase domain-containing protein [Chloroflexota bacterium]